MNNSRGKREEGNLLLFVEAANILEGKRTSSSSNSLNGVGLNLFKGNKRRKLQIAQAPTTVELLEVNTYAADIKRVENPFAKDDEDSDDDSDDASGHLPTLKFHTTKSVSHAKMIHNAKEKKRRRSLKQAQLALHQELQPYTHQKPILRTILCSAIEEIKKLKCIAEENKNSLSALKDEKDLLSEKLRFLKSLDKLPKDTEEYSNDDNNDSHKRDDSTGQQSVKCDCLLDDEESNTEHNSSEKQNQKKDYKQMVVEENQEHPTTSCNQIPTFTNPLLTSPLYCTTAAQLAALQAQSIQLAQLQTFTNPIWLPPLVWPNLNSLYSNVTGNQLDGTNSLYEKQHFDGVNGHVRKEVGSESYCSAVKCSVVKTTGNVDKRNQPCGLPKSKVASFTIDNLVNTV